MNVLRLVPPHGDPILVSQARVLVGRDAVCDVHLRDASVSRQHAEILRSGDNWIIGDLGSGNGIMVNGTRTVEAVLVPGQEIRLGNVRLRVEIDRGDDGATMIATRAESETDATIIQRHPPRDPDRALGNLRGEHVAGRASTPITRRSPTPPPAGRSRAPMILVGLVAAAGALLAFRTLRPAAPIPRSVETRVTPSVTAPATPATAAVASAQPTAPAGPTEPIASVVAPRLALLLITTDERAQLSIDGVRQPPLIAGEMRRVEVMSGEHLLTFDAGDGRREQVVQTTANEQSVVRFSGSTTMASAALAVASPTPNLTGRSAATPSPGPAAASSAPAGPASAAAPNEPDLIDEGLASGITAAEKGDFYRALLVLKDATRRLGGDPGAARELALANAYLAWTYHALDRAGEAVVTAQKAIRLDPSIPARLGRFPPPVRALFTPSL